MADLQLARFDAAADPDRVRSCYRIAEECRLADDPDMPPTSLPMFTTHWAGGPFGDPRQSWLAADAAGTPVGCCLLTMRERVNTALALCGLYVAPQVRRRGHGAKLLAHCADQARAAGRSRLNAEVRDNSAGAAFAAAAGATSGIAEVYRQLAVDASLRGRLPGLRTAADQRAAGYSLVSWTGLTPDEHLADSMRLSAAMADAPRDAGVDFDHWGADRIRTFERTGIENGQQFYTVAARHEPTGRLAAITQLRTDPGTPGWAFQALTAVLAEHRGHRLGLLVKVAMLELMTADRADVRRIMTSNAGPNEHMIAINEELGFEVVSVYRHWELDLCAAGPPPG